jgi:hypothetical protein
MSSLKAPVHCFSTPNAIANGKEVLISAGPLLVPVFRWAAAGTGFPLSRARARQRRGQAVIR